MSKTENNEIKVLPQSEEAEKALFGSETMKLFILIIINQYGNH